MSALTRSHARPSQTSGSTLSRIVPSVDAQRIPTRDDSESSESDDPGESAPATFEAILRQLNVQKRATEHHFRVLHDGLRDTNVHREEQRAEMRQRFDENDRRFDKMEAQLDQQKAQMRNQRATHVNNAVEAVGLDDGTPISSNLSKQYKHVHEFVRLKRPGKWQVLAELLHFYGSTSWPTWGLLSLSLGDESDEEEPLASHDSLEAAIAWAPEIALQELASYIGLDYNAIVTNVEEYERMQVRRAMPKKRTMAGKRSSPKRERLEAAVAQQSHPKRAEGDSKSVSSDPFSSVVGWDTRATEDRTPESQRPRFTDALPRRQRTASPTSVATSNVWSSLPARR